MEGEITGDVNTTRLPCLSLDSSDSRDSVIFHMFLVLEGLKQISHQNLSRKDHWSADYSERHADWI